MTIAVTPFFAFHSFTIRAHVLSPKMISFHETIPMSEDISFLLKSWR